jgi:hypothetical protein
MKTAFAFAIAIALMSPVLLLAVKPIEHSTEKPDAKLYPITYNISDLPVWRINDKGAPEYAPDLLLTYLRVTVDPKSWNTGADIRPLPKQASLVVCQSEANHKAISEAINSFRKGDGEVHQVRRVLLAN